MASQMSKMEQDRADIKMLYNLLKDKKRQREVRMKETIRCIALRQKLIDLANRLKST